jgi:hypothetical protein
VDLQRGVGGSYLYQQGYFGVEFHTAFHDSNAEFDPHLELDFHHHKNTYTQPNADTNSDLHTDT